MNTSTEFKEFKAEHHLNTADEVRFYLETCLEENDPTFFIEALGAVARSKGMKEISQQTGLGRESLYKAFGVGKKPRFDTVFKVIQALGLRFNLTEHKYSAN